MLPFGYGDTDPKTNVNRYIRWKHLRKIQTAGLGIGLERLMKFVSGSQTILDFIQPHDFDPNVKLKNFFEW